MISTLTLDTRCYYVKFLVIYFKGRVNLIPYFQQNTIEGRDGG
jgi:hypothetical protein